MIKNIKTYNEAIDDFFNLIKQIPMANRDNILSSMIIELGNSNLVVAQKILEYLQVGIILDEEITDDEKKYLDSFLAEIDSIDITDYYRLNDSVKKMKADQNLVIKKYLQKQEYNNYCILEKRALESNNPNDYQEINEELLIKAKNGNVFFKERLDVNLWLNYLEEHNNFNLDTNKRIAA